MNKLYILYFFIFCGTCALIYKYGNYKEGLDTDYNCNNICGLFGQVNANKCDSLNGTFTCINDDGNRKNVKCKGGERGKCVG